MMSDHTRDRPMTEQRHHVRAYLDTLEALPFSLGDCVEGETLAFYYMLGYFQVLAEFDHGVEPEAVKEILQGMKDLRGRVSDYRTGADIAAGV